MRVGTARAARPRRAVGGCVTAALTGVAVFIVVSVVASVLFMASPSANNATASFIQPQNHSVRWNGKSPLTILLMRADRPLSQAPPITSLVLATFNPLSRSATLLSIPSNLWVTIPGYGTGTVGEAYGDGGAALNLLVTQSALHVAIPYYAVIGSDTLQQLIGIEGGLTLRTGHGSQHLNGSSVLRYLSSANGRAAGQSSIDRNQSVLVGLERRALQSQMFFQIPNIVNSLGGSVPTNVPYDQIPVIAHALLNVPASRVHWLTLSPANGAVTPYSNGGTDVLLPDWQRIRAIAQASFPATWPTRGVPTVVLNGSGQYGAASRLADWLRQSRVQVTRIGTAHGSEAGQTRVYLAPELGPAAGRVARAVATLLQVPLVTYNVQGSATAVTILIGRNFQDPTQQ